jgi:nucleoid-associated protein YgaU
MVSRKQKLSAAGAVLAVGLAAAMLFRRDATEPAGVAAAANTASAVSAPVARTSLASAAFVGLPASSAPTPAMNVGLNLGNSEAPSNLATSAEFDAASAARPVYASIGGDGTSIPANSSLYRVHVVHNGDTLERLAERYLANGARALELFDLNREVLENPHLLPIGAELRIPTSESATRE